MSTHDLDRLAKRAALGYTPTAEDLRAMVSLMQSQARELRTLTERVEALEKAARKEQEVARSLLTQLQGGQ